MVVAEAGLFESALSERLPEFKELLEFKPILSHLERDDLYEVLQEFNEISIHSVYYFIIKRTFDFRRF